MSEDNALQEVSEHLPDAPVSPATGIASVALTLAMKYHDIGTVQDGVLYQQMKLDGKNLTPLHLDMVFETARRIELWILGSPNRLSEVIMQGLADIIAEPDPDPPKPKGTRSRKKAP